MPIAERFFAGGDATHRAYGRDELGIRGETLILKPSGTGFLPVGGDGLLLFNLEYRFPVFGDFGGTLFYDTGNVWADWRSIRPRTLKNGVGLGARYLSPIGPIRAGIGWKLDRERGESAYQCSSISGTRSRSGHSVDPSLRRQRRLRQAHFASILPCAPGWRDRAPGEKVSNPMTNETPFASIEEAIERFRRGEIVIIVRRRGPRERGRPGHRRREGHPGGDQLHGQARRAA